MGNDDLSKDIYLVAHVMRIGKMLYSESSKKTEKNTIGVQQVYKRPHGVAVHDLREVLLNKNDSEEKELTLKVNINNLLANILYQKYF